MKTGTQTSEGSKLNYLLYYMPDLDLIQSVCMEK